MTRYGHPAAILAALEAWKDEAWAEVLADHPEAVRP